MAPTTSIPIGAGTLGEIARRGIAVPSYDRAKLVPRLAHIGVGGFHRAHLALYVDELAHRGGDWGIVGIGLLAQDARMAAALDAQDRLYTLIERGPGEPRVRVIGSIVDYCLAAPDRGRAVAALTDPCVAIVSLTVTEAGYGTGSVAFDVLAAALAERYRTGAPPVTVLSCDNLPGNGDASRRATLSAVAAHSPDTVLGWVETSCTFPNSMVDRITPTTSADDLTWLHDVHGLDDRWPVVAEPFRQWVVEDAFAAGRPRWEDVGVLVSDRVHDWELYKLRILNAGHSAIAYLAALAGLTFVDEAMNTPEIAGFLRRLLYEEAIPSLTEIPGHPREDYAATVLSRFANTGVRDQIARLCIDGTAKYPTFLVPTVAYQLGVGGPIRQAATALAGWCRYLATVPPAAQAHDAHGDTARAHAHRASADPARFLDFAEVFPTSVRNDVRFRDAFVDAWTTISERGPLAALAG